MLEDGYCSYCCSAVSVSLLRIAAGLTTRRLQENNGAGRRCRGWRAVAAAAFFCCPGCCGRLEGYTLHLFSVLGLLCGRHGGSPFSADELKIRPSGAEAHLGGHRTLA